MRKNNPRDVNSEAQGCEEDVNTVTQLRLGTPCCPCASEPTSRWLIFRARFETFSSSPDTAQTFVVGQKRVYFVCGGHVPNCRQSSRPLRHCRGRAGSRKSKHSACVLRMGIGCVSLPKHPIPHPIPFPAQKVRDEHLKWSLFQQSTS